MRTPRRYAIPTLLTLGSLALAALAQEPATGDPVEAVICGNLRWVDHQAPGFDPGLKVAVLRGDPARPDAPYVVRMRLPDGYRFPVHAHPNAENITVLQGEFRLGAGETVDEAAAQVYRAGDFLHVGARVPHYGSVSGDTIIQIHGTGPLETHVPGEDSLGK